MENVFASANHGFADRPYHPVGIISDIHFPKSNADARSLYEMITHNRFGLLCRNGDGIDGWVWGADDQAQMTPLQLCVLDLIVRRQEEDGMAVIDNVGNHDEKGALPIAVKEAAKVGLIYGPGLRIKTQDGQATLVIHGHQIDSDKLNSGISRNCDMSYADISTHSTASASATKRMAKRFLAAMGYDRAYRYAAWLHNADRIVIGHRHLPETRPLVTFDLCKKFKNVAMLSLIRVLPHIIPPLSKILRISFFEKTLREGFLEADNSRVAQMGLKILDINNTKPDLSILKEFKIANLTPRYRLPIPDNARAGKDPVEFIDAGSWIDDNATFVVIRANGHAERISWTEERLKRGLPEHMPSEAEMVAAHYALYGGLHPKTLAQVEFYETHIRGGLPQDLSMAAAALPKPHEIWHAEIHAGGSVNLKPPENAATPDIYDHMIGLSSHYRPDFRDPHLQTADIGL
jgi:UDP-2,3-diacylglucosamine pyrophosphatase LpxH